MRKWWGLITHAIKGGQRYDRRKTELYSLLVREVEGYAKEGRRITRFGVLKILGGWFGQLDRSHIDLAEKLYADGFVDE